MQTALAATWIYFLFGLTITAGNANRNQICQDPRGATYESGTCYFSRSTCEWRNTEGSQIFWERHVDDETGHMSAPMVDASTNSVARLASPWFQATGNQQCTLQFWYYFGGDGNCQLSAYVDNDTSSMELFWQTESPTRADFEPIRLPHSSCRHRIIIEAKKLRDGHRRYNHDKVYISNIVFRCSRPLTPTTAAGGGTVTTPYSLSPRVSPTGRTAASPSTTSDLSSSRAWANCDFSESTCAWGNTEGSQILWVPHAGYMRASMSGARPNSVARLASPWFRATGNQQCTLQFRYYFGQNDNCQLSVYLDNVTSSTELVWRTTRYTWWGFQDSGPISLRHSNCSHRMIFEAKKLRDGPCGHNDVFGISYNEVDIDNIVFRCSGPLTATTAVGGRTVTTPFSLSPRVSPTGRTAASPSTTSGLSSSRAGSGMLDTEGTGTGRNIQLIVGVVLSIVVVVVVVLVIVYCRITNRCGAISGKNLKLLNASSSGAPTQSERNGAGDWTNTGNTHSNPAFVSDDGVTSAYYLARDQECLYSVPNKPRHGNKATSDGHPKGDNRADNAGQDDYNHLSLNKSRAGPSSSPRQRRAAQPYDHLARGDEHHGDVTEPTPGDRRTGCGTRTLMADVLQSDEYNTLSITTLRASASSAAAPPSSARTYDHLVPGERGHQTWPAGDSDPTRASGRIEEVYEHTK